MRIPEFAGMAATLGCNIVVGKFNGRFLVPYRNQVISGLLLVSPDAEYFHVVHNTFTEWPKFYPESDPTRWKTRTLGLENSVFKHNHSEYVDMDTLPESSSRLLAPIEKDINGKMR